jgi:hypothetical protein
VSVVIVSLLIITMYYGFGQSIFLKSLTMHNDKYINICNLKFNKHNDKDIMLYSTSTYSMKTYAMIILMIFILYYNS